MPRPARVSLGLAAALSVLPASSAHPCLPCHAKQVNGYARTGMANSLSRPGKQPPGKFTHPLSGSQFTIQSNATGMAQRMERNGLTAQHPIAYVVGSGNHAFGYLVAIGDYLFQSPISYYSQRKVWDMA